MDAQAAGELLAEHVGASLVKIGRAWHIQSRGIPQACSLPIVITRYCVALLHACLHPSHAITAGCVSASPSRDESPSHGYVSTPRNHH